MPAVTEVLDGVSAVEFLFYDQNLAPLPVWPVAPGSAIPRAVEVNIELVGWGRVTRLFRMAGAPA